MGIDRFMRLPPLSAFWKQNPSPLNLSRRRLMLAGAAGLAATAGAAALMANAGQQRSALPARLDLRKIEALGNGFFLVDGWVLTTEDVERLGGDLTKIATSGR